MKIVSLEFKKKYLLILSDLVTIESSDKYLLKKLNSHVASFTMFNVVSFTMFSFYFVRIIEYFFQYWSTKEPSDEEASSIISDSIPSGEFTYSKQDNHHTPSIPSVLVRDSHSVTDGGHQHHTDPSNKLSSAPSLDLTKILAELLECQQTQTSLQSNVDSLKVSYAVHLGFQFLCSSSWFSVSMQFILVFSFYAVHLGFQFLCSSSWFSVSMQFILVFSFYVVHLGFQFLCSSSWFSVSYGVHFGFQFLCSSS